MRMHRRIAILLLGIFLSNAMEAHQLLKLPTLFQHLSEHQANGHMNWLEFMSEHYIRGHHADQDHHHSGLPFHADNHCAAQTIQARLPDPPAADLAILNALDLELTPTDEHILLPNRLSDIWQPPRM
jgi:hypothetical protein